MPATLPTDSRLFQSNGTFIGNNVHDGQANPVYLSDQDRSRHIHIIGKTGTGKTVFFGQYDSPGYGFGQRLVYI